MKHKKNVRMKKIVLTGGGTAGHVTPNVALIATLRQAAFTIWYIGSSGIEKPLIQREDVPFYTISTGKLRRYFDVKNMTDLLRIMAGFFQSVLHLVRLKPNVIFSKGGFVSVPVVWAAGLLRIPVVIHESDITPGLANRLSMPFAKSICYSFPETAEHLPQQKRVFTGIPIRKELMSGSAENGRKRCTFTDDKKVLLIIGGSQGSQIINSIVRESLETLLTQFNICHICGKGNLADISRPGYAQFEYVNLELADLFACADYVISRAGATTLFELLFLKKPALLIPLGAGSRGDQIFNARSFERQGFSKVLLQDDLTSQTLNDHLNMVIKDRQSMIDAMSAFTAADASEKILGLINSCIHA